MRKESGMTRTVSSVGTIIYRNADGDRHREDGPAAIYANGNQYWYKNGECHREDGPAIVYADGTQFLYEARDRTKIVSQKT